jgi:type I restriction enzyme S subunit
MSLDLLFPNFETLIRTPEDVARLNEAILQLAVQGKLVPQDPADEPASELLKRIRAEKRRLVKEGKLQESKVSRRIEPADIPYELPEPWVWVRLDDAGIINPRNNADDDLPVSFIPMTLIQDGIGGGHTAQEALWRDIKKGFTHFAEGDVGVAKITPCFQNRKSTVFRGLTNGIGAGTTELHIFRPLEDTVLPEYVLAFVQTPQFIENGKASMTGTAGQQRVPRSYVEEAIFPLPPLAEQRRIVTKVESLFAQTRALAAKLRQAHDDIVTVNRAALNRLSVAADADAFAAAWATVRDAFDLLYDDPRNVAELCQAILQLAVQGKLVPQDPADEPASELLKRIRAEKRRLVKEGKIQSEDTLPPISPGEMPFHPPIGWHWVKLNELAEIVSGVTKGRNLVHFETISLPYLRVANVQRGYLDLSEIKEIEIKADEKSKYLLRNGDLLLTEGGDADKLGRAAIWRGQIKECLHQNHIFRARPYLPELPAEWLMLYTNSAYGRGYFLESSKQTTNLASINSTQLKNCPMILPPVAEQKRILAKVDQLMRQCDALEAGLARAEGQRRALAAPALHGAFR